MNPFSGVSISTDDRQNTSATLLREVGSLLEAGNKVSIKLKKDSVKTYIKIQFAGPRQTFCFISKIFKTSLELTAHHLPKLVENTLSFLLNLVPRTLEIAF